MLKLILALILIPTFAHADDESAAKALNDATTRFISEFSLYDDHHDEALGAKEIQALEPIANEVAKECKANKDSKSCFAIKRFKDHGLPIVEAIIDHEKEVGKISGVVNATNLHTAGKELDALIAKIMGVTSDCPAYSTDMVAALKATSSRAS